MYAEDREGVKRGFGVLYRRGLKTGLAIGLVVALLGFIAERIRVSSSAATRTISFALEEVVRSPVKTFEEALEEQKARCEFMEHKDSCKRMVNLLQYEDDTLADICKTERRGATKERACRVSEDFRDAYVNLTNANLRFLKLPP